MLCFLLVYDLLRMGFIADYDVIRVRKLIRSTLLAATAPGIFSFPRTFRACCSRCRTQSCSGFIDHVFMHGVKHAELAALPVAVYTGVTPLRVSL